MSSKPKRLISIGRVRVQFDTARTARIIQNGFEFATARGQSTQAMTAESTIRPEQANRAHMSYPLSTNYIENEFSLVALKHNSDLELLSGDRKNARVGKDANLSTLHL